MYAIADIFPIIKSVRAWTAGINDTLAALQLTPREHEDILIAAAELVGRLTDSCNPTSRSNERHTDPASRAASESKEASCRRRAHLTAEEPSPPHKSDSARPIRITFKSDFHAR
jgi:hypothetical protein